MKEGNIEVYKKGIRNMCCILRANKNIIQNHVGKSDGMGLRLNI